MAKAKKAVEEKAEEKVVPRLKEIYKKEIIPRMMEEFGYTTPMAVPRIEKIVLNMGLGEAVQNPKALEYASRDLALITGQQPVPTRAKKSIAGFKIKKGMVIGLMVTLRGDRMWNFLDKLINLALPRIRDFRGVPRNSFDGRGNYSLGIKEQTIFPEIEYDKIDKPRGLQVTIVTTAKTDEEARRLLELLGMPFERK